MSRDEVRALAEAVAALRRMRPGCRPRAHALGVSVSAGPWSISCQGVDDWYVSVRLQTVDEDHGWPTIAESKMHGQLTADAWEDAIGRALRLAAQRIDRAARTLPRDPREDAP